jgi:hypothetical protein
VGKDVQKTDLAAYERNLAIAERDFAAAGAAVDKAQSELNAARVRDGLKPLTFTELDEEPENEAGAEDSDSQEDEEPENARGFGEANKGNRRGGRR